MSKIERIQSGNGNIFSAMPLQILTVEKDGGDGVLVTFSDGTTAGYIAEELASLRPVREKSELPGHQNAGLEPAIKKF